MQCWVTAQYLFFVENHVYKCAVKPTYKLQAKLSTSPLQKELWLQPPNRSP
jgi:hypothetical protein